MGKFGHRGVDPLDTYTSLVEQIRTEDLRIRCGKGLRERSREIGIVGRDVARLALYGTPLAEVARCEVVLRADGVVAANEVLVVVRRAGNKLNKLTATGSKSAVGICPA